MSRDDRVIWRLVHEPRRSWVMGWRAVAPGQRGADAVDVSLRALLAKVIRPITKLFSEDE